MLLPFKGKHLQLYHTFSEGSPYKDKTIIIADGSVRSGKTAVTGKLFSDYILRMAHKYPGVSSAVFGQSQSSAIENVINPFIIPELDYMGLRYTRPSRTNPLVIYDGKYEIVIEVKGAQLSNSFTRVKGRTYLCALVDEGTEASHNMIPMLETRLSLPDSKLIINTNPDKPSHYIKTDMIDRVGFGRDDIMYYHFTLDDNPYIEDSVKDKLKKSFSGVFYDRYILGKWVVIEGKIYDNYISAKNVKEFDLEESWEYYLGLDFGWNDACAIVFMAYDRPNDTYYVIDEFIESHVSLTSMGDLMVGKSVKGAFGHKCIQHKNILANGLTGIWSGTEASQSRQEASGASSKSTILANYPQLKGIFKIKHHYVDYSIMSVYNHVENKLFVHPRCKKVDRDFNNWMYPEKDGEFIGEKPDPSRANHKFSNSMDAIRYLVDTITPTKQKSKIKVGFN